MLPSTETVLMVEMGLLRGLDQQQIVQLVVVVVVAYTPAYPVLLMLPVMRVVQEEMSLP
jgi:hypothetical protein